MRFVKNLYIGESVEKKKALIKWKLNHGSGMLSSYVIALTKCGDDKLEIYHNAVLNQKYYRKYPPCVVGIAGSFEEAALLSWKIMSDAGAENGNYDLWTYFGLDKEAK